MNQIWFNWCINLLWMASNLIQMMQNYCELLLHLKLYWWRIKIILPSQQVFFFFFFWDRIYWCHCEKFHILNIIVIIIISGKRRRLWRIGQYHLLQTLIKILLNTLFVAEAIKFILQFCLVDFITINYILTNSTPNFTPTPTTTTWTITRSSKRNKH